MSDLKKTLITGTLWSIGGQLISMLIMLGANIWLARLLPPTEFGRIGIIMFFVSLASVFTEGGFAGALIRKKDTTLEDYSTAFVFNLTISICCFLVIFLFSGFIADFYNDPMLQNLLIVSGSLLIVQSFQITQNAKLISDLKFKQRYLYRIVAVLLASIIGIISAYMGLGVWSLIIIQILSAGFLVVILWIFEGIFFSFKFDKIAFKELYAFGVNTTLASLLNTIFDNIYQLILGRYFSLNQVGYFYQARKLQDVPGSILNLVSQGVVFSSLAKLQHDKNEFAKTFNKISFTLMVILGVLNCVLFIYADSIIYLLFGPKWAGAVIYMQLLSIASFFYYLELVNRVIFKVFNQTKQILYLEIFKKIVQIITIIIGLCYHNIILLILGFVMTNFLSYFFNYYYSRRLINDMNVKYLLKLGILIVWSVISVSIILYFIKKFNITPIVALFTFPIFFVIYFIGLKWLNVFNIVSESFYVVNTLRSKNS